MFSQTFCWRTAMQHLHHMPQFFLIILFTQVAQYFCKGQQTPTVGRSLAVQEADYKSQVVHRVLEPVTIKSGRKMFVYNYKRKKKKHK